MNKNYIALIFLGLLLTPIINFNCKLNATADICSNNTICNDYGLCVCSQYHYGTNCDKILPNSNTLNVYSTGLSLGSYVGLIIGLIITFPVFLVAGLLIIYYSLKDRDY